MGSEQFELEAKMRDLLAKASVIPEAPAASVDSEKTSGGKAESKVLSMRGDVSLHDQFAKSFRNCKTDRDRRLAVEWAEKALDEARRGTELDEPLMGTMAWKRQVAAKVRAASTRKEVGEIARVAEISAATAYRWAKHYPAVYGERDASTRLEKAREAARLRDEEGLNGIQIAERMGVSRSYAYELLSDPKGDGVAARKAGYSRPCARGCGRRTNGSDGPSNSPDVCQVCIEEEAANRRRQIVAAWNSGELQADIARRFDLTPNTVRGIIQYARSKGEHVELRIRADRELWPLIEERWSEGATLEEIAQETGTTRDNIAEMVKTMRAKGIDLEHRAIPPKMWWPTITRMWRQGASSKEIAAKIGVAEGTVGSYIWRMRRAGIDLPKRRPGWHHARKAA